MSKLSLSSTLPLPNSSHKIPQLGFGVYQSPPETCVKSCLAALKAGYRHIDTAQYYANEEQVGQALKESGLKREEVYLTTKILSPGEDVDSTYKSVLESVEKLSGKDGYVDLFLIHSPNAGPEKRKLMWLALEKAKQEGKAREIGVSNYGIGHIEEIKKIGKVWPPAINQIEVRSSDILLSSLSSHVPAPPLVPAEGRRRILPEEQHHRRSLLPTRPQQEG
jgi:diketogulonate reductase-like aldo/keto reductase